MGCKKIKILGYFWFCHCKNFKKSFRGLARKGGRLGDEQFLRIFSITGEPRKNKLENV